MPIYKSTLNSNKSKTQKKEKSTKIYKNKKVNKKVLPITSLILSSFLFLMICIPNNFIRTFILGVFGLFAYPMLISIVLFSLVGLSNKKYTANVKYTVYLITTLILIVLLFHLILTNNIPTDSFSHYLKNTYKRGITGGGLLMSLISYPMVKYLTKVGAYIFTLITITVFVALILDYLQVVRKRVKPVPMQPFGFDNMKDMNDITDVPITIQYQQEEMKKRLAKQKLGIESSNAEIISSSMHINNINEKMPKKSNETKPYILTPPDIEMPDYSNEAQEKVNINRENKKDDVIVNSADDFFKDAKVYESTKNVEEVSQPVREPSKSFNKNYDYTPSIHEQQPTNKVEENTTKENTYSANNFNSSNDDLKNNNLQNQNDLLENYNDTKIDNSISFNTEKLNKEINYEYNNTHRNDTEEISFAEKNTSTLLRSDHINLETENTYTHSIKEEPKIENELGRPKKHYQEYVRPPVDLLNNIEQTDIVTDEECNENIAKLEQVLEDFKVPAKVKAVQVGPAVTRYELNMPQGISVKKVQVYSDDIAMALASNGEIRIEAPIPGKNAVGVEVPNRVISSVSLREMIDSQDFQKRVNPMSFVLGKDINGTIQFCNLDKMPHLLVAGSTGSGKSVCLNTMIISMIYKSSPEDLRLILIDPKTVEFSVYESLPHLLTPKIITTREQAINALNWAIKEMEYRYQLLQKNQVVNIKEYNNLDIVKNNEVQKLPYIVIVIDELGDLMIEAKRELEEKIMKLAQKSRAAGIHLVIATQRPSVDVITGTIKANLPSRIAFALTNFADSKTVLDMSGAEKLLGKGDMLFKPQDMAEPRRVQGAFVSSQEVQAVVRYIKQHNSTDFDGDAEKFINSSNEETQNNSNGSSNEKQSFDPILKDALKWFISTNSASITMIQRRFGVGYARAARIVDQMELNGFISPQDNSKPRTVLISMDQYNEIFGN